MTLRRFLVALALLAWSLVGTSANATGGTHPGPRRIVSLNLCTDQLVLALADRNAVRSVTWLARDPKISMLAAEAAYIPVNHGLAEEIVPLAPDLVLAGIYTTRPTVALLQRFGARVVEVDVPQSVPDMYEQIRTVARLFGHPERGEAMVAAMETALAALGPPLEGPRPVAAVYRLNNLTVRRG
ncbi:MAG: ABC transporter substrate-binding protein, partial [Deltaproteobacteria bacterium]|nr:ABC transporter substrate-binding protein [Deltaproteobacteria bacterium]